MAQRRLWYVYRIGLFPYTTFTTRPSSHSLSKPSHSDADYVTEGTQGGKAGNSMIAKLQDRSEGQACRTGAQAGQLTRSLDIFLADDVEHQQDARSCCDFATNEQIKQTMLIFGPIPGAIV